MICPRCSVELSNDAKFCVSCGATLSSQCPFCGSSNPAGGRFCQSCGIDVASAVPGLPIDRVKSWQGVFQSIGWTELPSNKWTDALREVFQSIGIGESPSDIDGGQHAVLFVTRLQDNDWKIRDFRVDGKKMGHGPSLLKRAAFGMVWAPAALMVKRSDQTWVIGTRDRLVLANFEDKQMLSWTYTDIKDYWVKDDAFGFSAGQNSVQFLVKKRGSNLVRNLIINQTLSGIDHAGRSLQGRPHDEAVHLDTLNQNRYAVNQSRQVNAGNVEFMQAIGYWLSEAAEIGTTGSR
jgi:hypothetical protein